MTASPRVARSLRLRAEVDALVNAAAAESGRSINEEIEQRLVASFVGPPASGPSVPLPPAASPPQFPKVREAKEPCSHVTFRGGDTCNKCGAKVR